MSGRWFRLYDELVDDPKVQMLPDRLFRALVNLWCLASRNEGILPPVHEVAFTLRMKPEKVSDIFGQLRLAGLIEDADDGSGVTRPHNWNGRQFKSDVSNERVKRLRERRRNGDGNVTSAVSATPPDTEQNRTDRSDASASAVEADDLGESADRKRLRTKGAAWLAEAARRKPSAIHPIIGRWLKLTNDDPLAILEVMRVARERNVVDPVAWIEAALHPKTNGSAASIDWPQRVEFYKKLGRWPAFWGSIDDVPKDQRGLFPGLFDDRQGATH